MNIFLKKSASKLPIISRFIRMEEELKAKDAELEYFGYRNNNPASIDNHPWKHPFLTTENISRFRHYSEQVWQFALEYQKKISKPLKCAFLVNMAQNMYKWGCLAKKYGADSSLFLHTPDNFAISYPEWEEFDGEFPDLSKGERFLSENSNIKLEIPVHRIPFEDCNSDIYKACQQFRSGNRKPLLNLLAKSADIRHEIHVSYPDFFPYYFQLTKELVKFDTIYAAYLPFAAYATRKPYCVSSTGGDLQYFCGYGNNYGEAMILSFNAARFLMVSNPHTLGHARRLGLTNGVYLPYPMDDNKYCPGKGNARVEWESRFGKGIYVLSTSRIDSVAKGHDENLLSMLIKIAKKYQYLHFIFLAWGTNVDALRSRIEKSGMQKQLIVLVPVGKKRLIDYYRSCDIVMDHFVYGYYGATALEAASIGKPVIMKLREEHYAPLYRGEVMPAMNASNEEEIYRALVALIDNYSLRLQKSEEIRQWLVRNHGEEKTVPLMLALLRITADQISLPDDLVNPLLDDESEIEKQYHNSCLVKL